MVNGEDLVRSPMYKQLNGLLRRMILDGSYEPGDKFLTEREVSARFDVSRATANKAVSSLVAEGLLEFRKGIGTFVRPGVLDYDLRSLVSFTEKATAAGKVPSTRVLRLAQCAAADLPDDAGLALSLADGEAVYLVDRVRLADGVPVTYERRVLAAVYCPGLTEAMLTGSLYALLTDTFGLEVEGADEVIRAVSLGASEAGVLEVARGSAALLVVSTGFLSSREPLWYERTFYRGDAYEFRNRLGPIRAARPATGALISEPHRGMKI